MRSYRRMEWEEWLQAAAVYRETYGDLLVPSVYVTPDGYKLGRWIERQRAMYNGKSCSTLNAPRIAALEQIGMVWKLEYRFTWNSWMEQVKLYVQEHGDLLVPGDYENGCYRLGNWIEEQRKKYAKGTLRKQQIKDLEAYGMRWPESEHRAWDAWYEDAANYYETFGDLLVPVKYETPTGRRLGVWICTQRERYAGTYNRAALSLQQILMLEKIGMIWNTRNVREDRWENMYRYIDRYYKENGKLPLWPLGIKAPDGRNVPNWIRMQRTRLTEQKCSAEQIKKLNRIGIYEWEKPADVR